ncbi:2-amino-4-hydroxy-6-hydroxymethyldihydropteridine diphosphokinase [candidate division WOR-3 bacterium 4484_100]|uniref:2-amino-4-hydroxy-6-hydroxymethyldihydropteridine diphosphokinase n=1 Tax=candidate division WOR-3 bacterium 4484_100 TaxID=1936077 RepID=A0A1V4QFX3_UNCW3|nr:MAG: 2-amino-4-hydroxy-6-hydroxymethyldihydropteridine diphosphokinase [candidate division WOR-3 bacterium 4484_100]
MEKIFLLLGTNLGNGKENLIRALDELEKKGITILRRSRIYKTQPWGYSNQPDFLNLGVEVKCDYPPTELLNILKQIEKKLGRIKGPRWGPRLIDIDIIFYGNQIVKTRELTIPHPQFFNRPFALHIIAELAPDFIPPGSDLRMSEISREVSDEGIQIYRG